MSNNHTVFVSLFWLYLSQRTLTAFLAASEVVLLWPLPAAPPLRPAADKNSKTEPVVVGFLLVILPPFVVEVYI